MPFLAEIKTNIESTQSTRKITQAMQLVAANKMRVFQRKALQSRSYAQNLLKGFAFCRLHLDSLKYAEERNSGPVLFVLLTSDKGLCGSLNQRLINKLFKSEKWLALSQDDRLLITIGRKSYEAATRRGFAVAEKFEGISESMESLQALHIVDRIIYYWSEHVCKEVILIAPHYVNPFVAHTTMKRYLPLSEQTITTHFEWADKNAGDMQFSSASIIYEPSDERVASVLSSQLIQTLFVQAFFELKASEYSSRMVAMKKASEAADEKIHELTLEFNKFRQATITQQLAELAASAIDQEDSEDSEF